MKTLATLAVALLVGSLTAPASAEPESITIAAVGDIACDPSEPAYNDGWGTPAGCQQRAVGDAIRSLEPDAFLALGDLQYIDGTYEKFMSVYDVAMGDLKDITRPIPGNHEYKTAGGAGYYQYFGDAAHKSNRGTYSFTMGDWHVIGLNSTACTNSSPCGPGSPMAKWIAADVAANPSQCLMAMWHHPIWSAGRHGGYAPMVPVWNQLNGYGADVVLTGHDHLYQRSQPLGAATLNADGTVADPQPTADGMVQFIVGTGGENNYEAQLGTNPAVTNAMAAVASNTSQGLFGPLKMTLGSGHYDFEFVPAAGSTAFQESGSGTCRTKTAPTGLPTMPANIQITRAGDGTVTVSWDGGPATHTVRVVGSSRKCETTTTACTITGLTNGTPYQVTVTASNSVADLTSPPSDPFIPAMKPSRPGVPSAVVNGGQVTVTWTSTPYNGGLPVLYVATVGSNTCTTAELECTLEVPPGNYPITVRARNEVGDSATQTALSPVAVNIPSAPTVASLTRAGDGKIAVTVIPAADAPTYPLVDYLVKSTPSSKSCIATLPATSCTVTGLTNGTSYTFTAVARTATVSSAPSVASPALIAARPPARLAAPSVAAAGPGAVSLTWSATTYEGGLPVTGYEVLVGNGPTVACATTALSCTATGLTKGTNYWFTVVAINDAGRSMNSPGSAVIKPS